MKHNNLHNYNLGITEIDLQTSIDYIMNFMKDNIEKIETEENTEDLLNLNCNLMTAVKAMTALLSE